MYIYILRGNSLKSNFIFKFLILLLFTTTISFANVKYSSAKQDASSNSIESKEITYSCYHDTKGSSNQDILSNVPKKQTRYLLLNNTFSKWEDGIVNLAYNPTNSPLSNDVVVEILKKSFKNWEDVCNVKFNLIETNSKKELKNYDDKTVAITWVSNLASFAGRAGHHWKDTAKAGYYKAVDGSFELSINSFNNSVTSRNTNLESVATHELGHLLGFGHSDNPSSILFSNPYNNIITLTEDDIQICQDIYGKPIGKISKNAIKFIPPSKYASGKIIKSQLGIVENGAVLKETQYIQDTDIVNDRYVNLYVEYENWNTNSLKTTIVDPYGYVHKEWKSPYNYKSGYANFYLIETTQVKPIPGTWNYYITNEDNELLLHKPIEIKTTYTWNKPPNVEAKFIQNKNQVKVNISGTDPENNPIFYSIIGGGIAKEYKLLNKNGTTEIINISQGDNEIIVLFSDKKSGYSYYGKDESNSGKGSRKVIRKVFTYNQAKELYDQGFSKEDIVKIIEIMSTTSGWNMMSLPQEVKLTKKWFKINGVKSVYTYDGNTDKWDYATSDTIQSKGFTISPVLGMWINKKSNTPTLFLEENILNSENRVIQYTINGNNWHLIDLNLYRNDLTTLREHIEWFNRIDEKDKFQYSSKYFIYNNLTNKWHYEGVKLDETKNLPNFDALTISKHTAYWFVPIKFTYLHRFEIKKLSPIFTSEDINNITTNIETIDDTPPSTVINVISNGDIDEIPSPLSLQIEDKTTEAKVDTTKNEVVIKKSESEVKTQIGKPLFVNGDFKGMISGVEASGTSSVVKLTEAKDIFDVYKQIDVNISTDEFADKITRSINNQQIGKYDYLNDKPLIAKVINNKSKTRGKTIGEDDLILRIDIPKGYKIPIDSNISKNTRAIGIEGNIENSETFKLNATKKFDYVTITTDGSYVEFGLSTTLSAFLWDDDGHKSINLSMTNNAHFVSNLQFTATTEITRDWEKEIDIFKSISLPITPKVTSILSKATINFKPTLVLQATGVATGELGATSYTKKTGKLTFIYDSRFTNGLPYLIETDQTNDPNNGTGVNININADSNFIVYPNIKVTPQLIFRKWNLRTTNVDIGAIRSGVRIDSKLSGMIDTGFATNSIGISTNFNASASANMKIYPYVDASLDVKIGEDLIYNSGGYQELWQGNSRNIFDFLMEIVDPPSIIMTEPSTGIKSITFSINDVDKSSFYYMYTIDGSTPSKTNGTKWISGNTPIKITKNTILKVVAYSDKKDPSSTWSVGYKFSKATTKTIEFEKMNPVAKLKVSQTTINEGDSVTLDASESSDPDGVSLTYKFSSNLQGDLPSSGNSLTISSLNVGTHTIILTVTDNDVLTATTTVTVTVKAVASSSSSSSSSSLSSSSLSSSSSSSSSSESSNEVAITTMTEAECSYTLQNTTSQSAVDNLGQSLFKLQATFSDTKDLLFTMSKIDGSSFGTNGTVGLQVGSGEDSGAKWEGTSSILPMNSSDLTKTITAFKSDLVSRDWSLVSQKDFYVRYEDIDGGWAYVGTIALRRSCSAYNNSETGIIKDISAGFYHNLILKNNGFLYAFGDNGDGEYGNGSTVTSSVPVKIMENVSSMSAGTSYSLILKTDGSLYSTGKNAYGNLGEGTTIDRLSPTKIMENVSSMSAGNSHSLILKTDGTLYATGDNFFGYLGDGTTVDKHTPVKVMDGVSSISAGYFHNLVLKTDGSLYTFGSNWNGALGDGSDFDQLVPTFLMNGIRTVSAGRKISLVVKNNGSLYSFGANFNGQLGDGTTESKNRPVKVMEGVHEVSAGAYHSLILKTDGTLYATGLNERGALGDGTTVNKSTPVKVMENVKTMSAGGLHSLVLTNDGLIHAMGANNSRQIGEHSGNALSPIQVKLP